MLGVAAADVMSFRSCVQWDRPRMDDMWDVAIVGVGPAGSAAALRAAQLRPELRVLLLDRADFPRDKPCGDGIAAHGRD